MMDHYENNNSESKTSINTKLNNNKTFKNSFLSLNCEKWLITIIMFYTQITYVSLLLLKFKL